MIDDTTIGAFGDEIEKISGALADGAKKVLDTGKKWMSTGWNKPLGLWEKSPLKVGPIPAGSSKKDAIQAAQKARTWQERPDATWMGKGKVTKYLPVGDKSLTTGFTGMMIPAAIRKEDSMGLERSRGERVSGLAGGTVGGLLGMGAMSHLPMKGWGLTRTIAGGVIGGMAGEHAATMPFRRKAEMPAQQMVEQPQMGNGVA